MESLLGGFPLPFQRRLTKMYTDTKSSYDFVKEPIQSAEDPELMALHRKLRIQKDRLVSWGLEWSDPAQSPDIDESISKAGLSELVGSVMSTIKEILAEAEPLWQSSKRTTLDEKSPSSEKSVDRKPSLILWDKSRFEDLVRDLTMSIDTLYDLSRSRQSARRSGMRRAESTSSMQAKVPIAEERQFESTRMQTPQQIDPASLIWPKDLKTIASNVLPPADSTRHIVFMRRPTASTISRKTIGSVPPTLPILLEHAPYDSIYSITGISPDMKRFERLFSGLSQAYISSNKLLSGILRLIGYFEEPEHSRFCLLYALPTNFGPVDIESPSLPMPAIITLSDLLSGGNFEPSLEIKYRLAYNVANAVFELHSKGVVHGNLYSSNVLFFEQQPASKSRIESDQINLRQSYLASFDLFSDNATQDTNEITNLLHRHPLDPRTTRYTHLTSESKSLDLYSLAMLLLEIGLWSSLKDIFPNATAIPETTAGIFQKLASRCGNLYVKAVQSCWHAPDDELSQKARPDVMHQKVYWRVSKALDTCCAIDEASEEESDEQGSPIMPSTPSKIQTDRTMAHVHSALSKVAAKEELYNREWSEKPVAVVKKIAPAPVSAAPKPKLRTFPSIRISQEHLNYWHTGLMPHINYVLRGFYKKYPESVEISLESIGESASKTKPTILVICTSVNKVRSILKKSLVYDKTTYGLKVCRGKVVRSRKHDTKRSMARDNVKPANVEHQESPSNGASIGAYDGEKHLPPVSFGGLIMVDDQPYGMTVHHMLDEPEEAEDDEPGLPILRSSASGYPDMPSLTHSESSVYSDEEFMCEFSDYDSDAISETTDSDYAESEADSDVGEPGDIKGIAAGDGDSYIITQPAIDDVDSDFYPDEETRDEDHLDSHSLGEVYASSGIRRREDNGIIHEIDWALFTFNKGRTPSYNHISKNKKYYKSTCQYPISVLPSTFLSNTEVHCMARTSGLQSGRIMPGMVSVKIYGRITPAQLYAVSGRIGIPGDSGAWVVDNEQGRACGHVLAWSARKRNAYICPMDVLLQDIGETLGASTVSLPGGGHVYLQRREDKSLSTHLPPEELEDDTIPELVQTMNSRKKEQDLFTANYSLTQPAPPPDIRAGPGGAQDLDHLSGLDIDIDLDRMHISEGVFSQG